MKKELEKQQIQTVYNTVSQPSEETPDVSESLKKLKEMFDNNLITEEEYNNKKAELLNQI